MRKGIIPGNSKSLWRAINIAKDLNNEDIPVSMFERGILIPNEELADHFADHFERKIAGITSNANINDGVYKQ